MFSAKKLYSFFWKSVFFLKIMQYFIGSNAKIGKINKKLNNLFPILKQFQSLQRIFDFLFGIRFQCDTNWNIVFNPHFVINFSGDQFLGHFFDLLFGIYLENCRLKLIFNYSNSLQVWLCAFYPSRLCRFQCSHRFWKKFLRFRTNFSENLRFLDEKWRFLKKIDKWHYFGGLETLNSATK